MAFDRRPDDLGVLRVQAAKYLKVSDVFEGDLYWQDIDPLFF